MTTSEKKSILIVEDETINLNMLISILGEEFTLIVEKSGLKAIQRAEEQLPDLILLDIILPDLDGYSVITALKNNELTKEIPVIFVSSLNNVEDEEKGFLLGAVDYVSKPYNAAIIRARVRTHMKLLSQRKLLEKIAMLDGLTEIPNRRSFTNQFAHEWDRASRNGTYLSLIVGDVDSFKAFNDHYGHGIGDVALKGISNAIRSSLNRGSDFVARIGGEEFAVILPECDREGGIVIGERICEAVRRLNIKHEFSAAANCITISLGGVTLTPAPQFSQTEMFEWADQQLYAAKNQGKNRLIWKV